jgi:hypothetical protein
MKPPSFSQSRSGTAMPIWVEVRKAARRRGACRSHRGEPGCGRGDQDGNVATAEAVFARDEAPSAPKRVVDASTALQ